MPPQSSTVGKGPLFLSLYGIRRMLSYTIVLGHIYYKTMNFLELYRTQYIDIGYMYSYFAQLDVVTDYFQKYEQMIIDCYHF